MDDFKKQLQNYRNRKKRENQLRHFSSKIGKYLMWKSKELEKSEEYLVENEDCEYLSSTSEIAEEPITDGGDAGIRGDDNLSRFVYFVLFLFWVTLYIIAIQLQFGIVFLMISALFAIYFNTRTGKRLKGEISAYSVFNKNCESISGTLKAEQFEKEMGCISNI